MNIYDEIEFFERYSQMDRSQKGLAGAGEWHILKKILPHFTQKKVLDLGCGYGWHSNYAIEQGAESVLGIDGSEKMLEVAREKFPSEKILFKNRKIEELAFEADTFDVVISSLVFHYIEDYPQLIKSIAKWLKEDGSWYLRLNIQFLQLMVVKIGFMMMKGIFYIFQLIIILWKERERLSF